MSLALVACDGDDDDRAPPPPTTTIEQPEPAPPQRRGVILSLDRDTASPGQTLELTVENTTRTRLEYGVMYRLERWTGERWRWLNRDSAWILLLRVVEAGHREREDIRLPKDLRPGRFRIVKSFTAPETERQIDASVEFRVA